METKNEHGVDTRRLADSIETVEDTLDCFRKVDAVELHELQDNTLLADRPPGL